MPVYLTNINLSGNEIQNAVVQPLATAPSNPRLGQIYTDSLDSKIKWYNGTAWATIGVVVESSSANGAIVVDGVPMTVYTLPAATANALGGIKVGAGLTVTADGVLSATVINNLTSDATNQSLSAAMGKSLKQSVDGLTTSVGNKVDKVTGKQLSTNDYTTSEKNKLAGIATGAEVNVNADWNASSGDAQILNKPTALSSFTNDRGFIDSTATNLANYYLKTQTYTKLEVDTLIGSLSTISIVSVSALPAIGSSHIIYLVPKSGSSGNVHEEYLWTGTTFEKIGDTEIDLSNYLLKTGDGKDVTVTFSQASTRANVASGEKLSILMGKLAKAFSDLKSVAFSGSYVDLSNKPSTVKSTTFNISTTQTTNTLTITGTQIIGVTVLDTVTKEIVFCDITINGLTVTTTVSARPTNTLQVIVAYY